MTVIFKTIGDIGFIYILITTTVVERLLSAMLSSHRDQISLKENYNRNIVKKYDKYVGNLKITCYFRLPKSESIIFFMM